MKQLFTVIAATLFGILLAPAALAQAPAQASCMHDIKVATGTATGTYSKVFKNIQNVCPMACEYTDTTGGFDNVMKMLENKVDAGIAQVDTLEFLKRQDPRVERLRSLAALHTSSMHIVVSAQGLKEGKMPWSPRTVFDNLRQLKGRKVAAFASAQITARVVSERLQLGLETVDVASQKEGLALVESGEVAALMGMGGQPLEWVEKLPKDKFSLANVDVNDIQSLGAPYFNVRLSYRTLDRFGINSVTVRNELIARDFKGAKSTKLVNLRECLRGKLQDIKEADGAHAAWGDVEDLDATSWTKYGENPPASPSSGASKRR